MSPEVAALMEALEMRERMNDQFLKELVAHLALCVPGVDGPFFLEQLHQVQERLPSPDMSDPRFPKDRHSIGLELWRRKIELTERALHNAEVLKSKS